MRTSVFLLIFMPLWSLAQWVDDFSDGDFSTTPAWSGMDSCFIINGSQQLQSAGTVAGEAYLSRSLLPEDQSGSLGEDMEWRFWIRENFNPSANNYAEVWLMADSADLRNATKGYFLRFGAAGSQDAIELYRMDPGGETLVCKGADASIASSFKMAVKVNRDAGGHWTLLTDPDNMGFYTMEAQGQDSTYHEAAYFGFYIKYTSSNARKFYFDDVYVGEKTIDSKPPTLLSLNVVGPNGLVLGFDEPLDSTALLASHYRLEPEIGFPDHVQFGDRPSIVRISFPSPLPENQNLQLWLSDIKDQAGNVVECFCWDFCLYAPGENDVVINEIMADPTPVVGLPEWEYIELFNTTGFRIDLTGWILCIGTTLKDFAGVQLDPHGYLILCKTDAEQELSSLGPTCGFSSFSIANAGATLRLLSPEEKVISEVSFNDTWYHDADKKAGGWSLEQIDPYNPCAGTFNWSASEDSSGGTPGRENSINAPNAFHPQVERVSMLGDDMVFLWFDQQMDRASLEDPSHYQVLELDVSPIEVICNPLDAISVGLKFDVSFLEGELYTLSINGVTNCSGNYIEEGAEVRFGIPLAIGASEVLINEILFDPIAPGVDFVELYNPTDKTFDLSELRLGVIKESFPNPPDTVLKEIVTDSRLLLPQTYLLLSTDGYQVAQQYACALADYVDMASFPSYPNSGGEALLMSRQGAVVDQMTFSPSMHYPLLKESKGVSLERVSWEVPSSQRDNWHSASEAVGFGTPGYANSMRAAEQIADVEWVSVAPKVFSPDGDGFDDHCVVSYEFEDAGGTMNVYVFNADGQLIRHLVRGELIGNEGSFVWNGLDQKGRQVPFGIYVFVTEVFDMEGKVLRCKNAVTVASR